MSERIKVAGYAQSVFFENRIEYRNFSPDLVGLQLTSEGGTPLFTMGNFSVTTNVEPKRNKKFITNKFSNFVSLSDIDLTLQSTLDLLTNNAGVILNLDKRNLNNYALFGSLKEYVRVALETIITDWPAALYVNPIYELEPDYVTQSGLTVENYTYDSITNEATFKVNTNTLGNTFVINYLSSGIIENNYTDVNDLRNLTVNYESYAVSYQGQDYSILDFTGSTSVTNDYVYFKIQGNAFSAITSQDYLTYYIRPNQTQINLFFNGLSQFEAYLLNRKVDPIYTANFNFTIKSDSGDLLYVNDTLTWPTTDGYNLDFNTQAYDEYASKLLEISTNYDLTTSNLMVRFLVTESITDFDTTDVHFDPLDMDTSGQKMNKTLNIYGVQFDKINNHITNIKFADTVTYDKQNNIPDIYLKNLAKILGWELISSVVENDLLKSYIEPKASTYSGQSVGLTAVEADVELWRRLILNTPWLWKSKGTRKAIEFLFRFIGTPLGLITFNEYVYLAENKIDIDVFEKALVLNGANTDLSTYPISVSGYPKPLVNTPEMYFQGQGLWHRETGGDNSTLDINTGNNPHVGAYDGGFKYVNQFQNLIPNFSAVTVSSETTTTTSSNLFTNYNRGKMTAYSGNTYVDITTDTGVDFSDCYVVTPTLIEDPKHRQDQSDCGCDVPSNLKALSICVEKNANTQPACQSGIANMSLTSPENYYSFNFYQYNINGSIYLFNGSPAYYNSPFVDKACCNFSNSVPYFWNQVTGDGITIPFAPVNSGYICCNVTNTCGCMVTCKWKLATPRWATLGLDKYLVFKTETGVTRMTSQDGCNCVAGLSVPVQITDPYTNEVGYGCQLTQDGVADVDLSTSILNKTYNERASGTIRCEEVSTN